MMNSGADDIAIVHCNLQHGKVEMAIVEGFDIVPILDSLAEIYKHCGELARIIEAR